MHTHRSVSQTFETKYKDITPSFAKVFLWFSAFKRNITSLKKKNMGRKMTTGINGWEELII
jgi:hypothetical protein